MGHNDENLTIDVEGHQWLEGSGFIQPAAKTDTGELEMVVWLRGDEPLCQEFSLDADNVMAQLGIKRTRLTQISGRELRVGRMRAGRYIKPVYRQIDVDAYKAWTRAPASHQKSSEVLKEAATLLAERAESFSNPLADSLEILRETSLSMQRRAVAKAEALLHELAGKNQQLHQDLSNVVREESALTRQRLRSQDERLKVIEDRQALLLSTLSEMAGHIRYLTEEQALQSDLLAAAIHSLEAKVTQLMSDGDIYQKNLERLARKNLSRSTQVRRSHTSKASRDQEPSHTPMRPSFRRAPKRRRPLSF